MTREDADPELATALWRVLLALEAELVELRFGPPVAFVYDPLQYAAPAVRAYLSFARRDVEALFLGMNPGPWGMAQTGVPFGAVPLVRDWLGITAAMGRPDLEHPAKPVRGFDCARVEVSGARLWGWARSRFGSPERFFVRFQVLNYCPLLFLDAGGRNLTPDQLPAADRTPLLAACDRALAKTVALLAPQLAIGVGGFAAARLRRVLAARGVERPRVGQVLHPSPASPLANRGWEAELEKGLANLGVVV